MLQYPSSLPNLVKKPFFSRVRITISCRMMFDDYPLDAHTCQFQVGSCKSSLECKNTRREGRRIIYRWTLSRCHMKWIIHRVIIRVERARNEVCDRGSNVQRWQAHTFWTPIHATFHFQITIPTKPSNAHQSTCTMKAASAVCSISSNSNLCPKRTRL